MKNKIICGDCLEIMDEIGDGQINLIVVDPPYGTMKGINDKFYWDTIIPTKEMFSSIQRVLRQNGKCVIFSQEPYTTEIIKNQMVGLPFLYRAVWIKNQPGNCLSAKKAMVSLFEDICVFQNKCPNKKNSDATIALQKVIEKYGFYYISELMFEEGRYKNIQSARKNLSKKCINNFDEKDYDNFMDKKMLTHLNEKIDLGFSIEWYLDRVSEYKRETASVFNLWKGEKSKSNVLEYKKDKIKYHPTQKPVSLLEDIIKTYSNVGDTVLDFTMGSGSTGVACVNTNRYFIGIEISPEYCKIAEQRLRQKPLF